MSKLYPGQQVGVPDGQDVFNWGHIGLSFHGRHPVGKGWRYGRDGKTTLPIEFKVMYVRRPYAFGVFKQGAFLMVYFGKKAMDFKTAFWKMGRYSNGSRWHSDAFVWEDDE